MASSKPHAALVSLGLAGAAVLFAFDPAAASWFPSCPLNALTGWLCPFCGTLRAVHALLRGHVEAAVAFNPLTTGGMAAGLAAIAHDAMWPTRPALVDRLVSLALSAPGLALAAIFGVVRNM